MPGWVSGASSQLQVRSWVGQAASWFSLCWFFNPEGAWRRLGSSAFCENLKSRSPCHTPVLSTAPHSPSRIPPVCSLPYRVLYSSASINPQLWKLNHFIFFFFLWSSFHDIPGKDIVEVTELALPLLFSWDPTAGLCNLGACKPESCCRICFADLFAVDSTEFIKISLVTSI